MPISKRWRNMPEPMKKLFFTPSMWHVYRLYNESDFGITSGFRGDRSKEKNLISQVQLGQKLSHRGYDYLAQVGAWHGVQERSLFIPRIQRRELRSLAMEFGQEAYIWGTKGHWCCYDSAADEVLAEGSQVGILAPDTEFKRYSKMLHRKYELIKHLQFAAKLEDEQDTKTTLRMRRDLARLERGLNRILSRSGH